MQRSSPGCCARLACRRTGRFGFIYSGTSRPRCYRRRTWPRRRSTSGQDTKLAGSRASTSKSTMLTWRRSQGRCNGYSVRSSRRVNKRVNSKTLSSKNRGKLSNIRGSRALHNGNALAFQARVAGSIPAARSSFQREKLPFWGRGCHSVAVRDCNWADCPVAATRASCSSIPRTASRPAPSTACA